jgi:glutathione S-transferase
MITLYGLQSPYVYRVRACLLQKGLPFQHVSVNMGNRSEEFRKLSPVGTIPVLEDEDGTTICDSFHIAIYLDEKYPHTYRMLGDDLKTKVGIFNILGLIDRMHAVNSPLLYEKLGFFERFRKGGTSHRAVQFDDVQATDAKKDLANRLNRAKELLGNREFFTGKFSFADAAMLILIGSLQSSGIDVGQWAAWKDSLMKEEKIALMFTPKDEKGAGEI